MADAATQRQGRELEAIFRQVLSPKSLLSLASSSRGATSDSSSSSSSPQRGMVVQFMSKVPSSVSAFPHLLGPPFSTWLLRRLVFLLSLGWDDVSAVSLNVQESLLRLLHIHSPESYRRAHECYLTLLDGLNSDDDAPEASSFVDESAEEDKDGEEKLCTLRFQDEFLLDSFRCHLTTLLSHAAGWTARFCSGERAWRVATDLIGCAEGALLVEALRWVGSMADSKIWPIQTRTKERFCCTLFDLLENLCDVEEGDFCGDFREDVENQAAALLTVLLAANFDEENPRSSFKTGAVSCLANIARRPENHHGGFLCLSGDLRRAMSDCVARAFCDIKIDECPVITEFLVHFLLLDELSSSLAALVHRQAEGAFRAAKVEASEKSKKRKLDADNSIHEVTTVEVAETSQAWANLLDILQKAQRGAAEDSVDLALTLIAVAKEVTALASAAVGVRGQQHQGPAVIFFPRECVGQFVQEVIQRVLSRPRDEEAFVVGNKALYDLLQLQPIDTLTQAILQQCVAVATLPWMDGEVKLADLRIGETLTHNFISASGKIVSSGSSSSSSLPRWALAGLPLASSLEVHVSPKWRQHVLRKAWTNGDAVARRTVVEGLAAWMHCFGNSAGALALVRDIVSQAMEKDERDVLEALSKSVGTLVCVQARQGTVARNANNNCISCRLCDGHSTQKSVRRNLEQGDIEYLLKLIGYPHPSVRRNALCLVVPISNHVGLTPAVVALFMNYLQDGSEECIVRFCQLAGHLVSQGKGDGFNSDEKRIAETVMSAVEEFCHAAAKGHRESASSLAESSCCILGNIAKATKFAGSVAASSHVKERLVGIMLDLFFCQDTHVEAYLHFGDYLKGCLNEHRQLVMSKIASFVCEETSRTNVLDYSTLLFSSPSVRRFLVMHVHHFIPYVVMNIVRRKEEDQGECPVNFVAHWRKVKPRHLLAENFQYIFPHMVIHSANKQEYSKVTAYMEKEMALPLSQLVPSNRQKIITELMANFHSYQKRVLSAFQWLAKNDEDFKKTSVQQRISSSELISYVQPKFLGVLGYFDQRLVNPHVPHQAKIDIMRSLCGIVQFMGSKSISSVKHKLLATFRTATYLKVPEIHSHLVQLWEVFLKTIDVSSLGTILTHVVAYLYPILEAGLVSETLQLYKLLFVEKEKGLRAHFPHLYFVPGIPELQEINAIIKRINRINEHTPFTDILIFTTKSVTNENSEVKTQALRKLKQLLWPNQGKVQDLIMSSEKVDPVINHLVEMLVKSTRDSDPEVVRLAGDCLGHVGAIDPGRLDLVEDFASDLSVCLNISEDEFVLQLLSTLVRSFLKCSESTDSDACAFALQEVLSVCDIKGPASLSSPGGRIWNGLSESEQEVATPFLTSHYCRTEKPVTYKTPVYSSRENIAYGDWLSDWSCHLMSKVKGKKAQEVFCACKAAIRKDTSCGQFLLPYVITAVLIQGIPDDTQEIIKEINVVIESSAGSSEGSASIASPSASSQLQSSGPTREQKLAVQTVFSVMDHLNKWLKIKNKVIYSNMRRSDNIVKVKAKDREYSAIEHFVQSVSQRRLAEASFRCGAYARALMHLENHLRKHPEEVQQSISKLQRIYSSLQNPDYVVGAASIREAAATLEERIFLHQATGNFQDALGCYEGLSKNSSFGGSGQDDADAICGTLECYLRLDRPQTAATLAKGKLSSSPELKDSLTGYQLEAAWQLSQWEDITEEAEKKFGADGEQRCWKSDLARLLASAKAKQKSKFFDLLDLLQRHETSSITAASMEEAPYQRSYEHVVRLQILNEVEQMAQTVLFSSDRDLPGKETLKELLNSWSTRTTFGQYTLETQEPVMKVRRALMELARRRLSSTRKELESLVEGELGESVTTYAKIARKAGQMGKAFNLLIDAEQFESAKKSLFLEWAKLHWARGNREVAIDTLKDGISRQFPWAQEQVQKGAASSGSSGSGVGADSGLSQRELRDCTSAKLLLARYVDEAANLEAESVPQLYNDARAMAARGGGFPGVSAEVLHHSAQFYDKIIGKNYKESDLDMKGDMVYHVIAQYCRSLLAGSDNIHQSLPRLLSLWLDYGSRVSLNESSKAGTSSSAASGDARAGRARTDMANTLKRINDLMAKFTDQAPAHYFLLVFPQLTSRICHPHKKVWDLLKAILFKTFVGFPHQAFWHMVALSKSSFATRSKRCKEIFAQVESHSGELKKFIADGISLADKLHQLAEEKISHGTQDLTEVMPGLLKLLSTKGFSQIMIPTTKNMTVTLSTAAAAKNVASSRTAGSYFCRVETTITVMRSLVQPKKVTFLGTDGHRYSFLCKPKDDLRRDCRLVDFNNLLNKLFVRDPECRRRGLKIRTYKVIPLNETSGLIEWVENLSPLRNILQKLHRDLHGVLPIGRHDIDRYANVKEDPERNRRSYRELCKRFPPVFAEWFVRNFPDPQTWFLARLGYTHTTAVMSMVGYLLGLGDRHAENIMFDSSNGDAVHVDLNCLFNKGDDLNIPEVVPFRLTRNLLQAMGPTGHEGPFRIACEVSLGLMRRRKDLLMCALRPFYFDPLVDWVPAGGKRRQGGPGQQNAEGEGDGGNEKAAETLAAIQSRLDGLVSAKKGGGAGAKKSSKMNIPLSVAGQVNFLIKEATSEENLSQMYIGWAPYY